MTRSKTGFAAYLDSLANFGIEPSLAGIEALCRALGGPQRGLGTIQVTGTNGKTSTARMAGEILAAHGLAVGVYTSPHLESYTERILLNGQQMGAEAFETLGRAVREAVAVAEDALGHSGERGERRITQFEVLTGAALKAFADAAVDVAVVEVGMGGRWDATSVVRPAVSIAANVTLDHAEWLGPELTDIAAEKAYVLKEGTIGVLGEMGEDVKAVFRARADIVGARVLSAGTDFSYGPSETGIRITSPLSEYTELIVGPAGGWQLANATLATVAAEAFLGRDLDERRLRGALSRAISPGRAELFPGRPDILVDGAHNLAGVRALVGYVRAIYGDRRMAVVTAVMRDKRAVDMAVELGALGPLLIVDVDNPRCTPATELAAAAGRYGLAATAATSIEAALDEGRKLVGADGLVVAAGSLYLAGPVRRFLREM